MSISSVADPSLAVKATSLGVLSIVYLPRCPQLLGEFCKSEKRDLGVSRGFFSLLQGHDRAILVAFVVTDFRGM